MQSPYQRYFFYALFPPVAFCTLFIAGIWFVKMFTISVGLFPFSLLLLIAFLPLYLGAIGCGCGGLLALWIFLWRPQIYARYIIFLPISFLPACFYLAKSLAELTAELGIDYPLFEFQILALQAHLIYPIIAFALAVLTWKNTIKHNAERPSINLRLIQKSLIWSLILLFWGLSTLALMATRDNVKAYVSGLKSLN